VNYADVAPSYGGGEAEQKLGPALKGRRDRLFLACKTARRDREGAAQELRTSLARLGTDHVDLYQMHALQDVQKDVDVALGPGGAIEAFREARTQGLVRFLGFSAHSSSRLKAIDSGVFDTILYRSISSVTTKATSTKRSWRGPRRGAWASWPSRHGARGLARRRQGRRATLPKLLVPAHQ